MPARAAILLVGLLAACTKTKASGFATKDAPIISSVHFKGNAHVDDDDLLGGISSQPVDTFLLVVRTQYRFDASELELDVRRIEAHYRAHGYFSTKVKARVEQRPENRVEIHFDIEEGQPSFVTGIQLGGQPVVPGVGEAEVLETLGLASGQIFVHDKYVLGRDAVKKLYNQRGYLFAEVKGQIGLDRDRRTAMVYLDVDPGPRVRFGKTSAEGMKTVPIESVLGRVAWEEGQLYDPELVALTEARLYGLGRFSSVRVDYDRANRRETVNFVVRVSESTRREVRLGGGFGVDNVSYEIRGRAAYQQRGFIWPMTTFSADFRPAYKFFQNGQASGFGGEARVGLDFDDFLYISRLRATTEVAYVYAVLEAYTIQGPRTRLGLDRAFLRDRLAAAVGWQLRYQWFVDEEFSDEVKAQIGIEEPYRLAAYEQTLSYDLRDEPLEPRVGAYFAVRLEEGGAIAGGAFDYWKAVPEARGYLPLGEWLVVAGRAQLGWADDYGDVVPITQRFFSGGSTSQRGFVQQHLSPTVADEDGDQVPVGGEGQFETSLELRWDAFTAWGQRFGFVGFVDGADVTLQPDQLFEENLHWATGLGVRVKTIAGAIRLDVGYRLNRKGDGDPYPDDPFAFHLTIGEAF